MSTINYEFIEKYQQTLEQDPKSKVFAPLGEAYRKMGLLKEAKEVLLKGVQTHPHFPSGQVALGKVLIELKDYDKAAQHLKTAAELSSENILAHRLLAETYIYLKKPKEALKAFKMVLFLNPNDAQAQSHIKKLESLTADEYEDEAFEMKPLRSDIAPKRIEKSIVEAALNKTETPKERILERIISLTDAFIARLDLDKAQETLDQAEKQLGSHPELIKRRKFLMSRWDTSEDSEPAKNSKDSLQRIDFLKGLLQKIESRRRVE